AHPNAPTSPSEAYPEPHADRPHSPRVRCEPAFLDHRAAKLPTACAPLGTATPWYRTPQEHARVDDSVHGFSRCEGAKLPLATRRHSPKTDRSPPAHPPSRPEGFRWLAWPRSQQSA